MLLRFVLLTLLCWTPLSAAFAETITRIWLTHPVSDASQLMINWETPEPAPSQVDFGPTAELGQTRADDTLVSLHHVAVPFPTAGALHYKVSSGKWISDVNRVASYEGDTLRVALAANWQRYPSLDTLLADRPHLLIGCGDFVHHLISLERPGEPDNTEPFSRAIDQYPVLFATIPFMPALGNHDRQIRPRMFEPLTDPTYDIDAVAFLKFFPLPNDGWKWHLDVPGFDTRFIALDLNHISDMGNGWQSCHTFDIASEQFMWYRKLMPQSTQRFVITLYNEQHAQVRRQNNGAWGELIRQGTMAITGFGLFAERAEVEGFPFFNTALKAGDIYADGENSQFSESVANYILLTIPREGTTATVAIKSLDGTTLDESTWKAR